MGCTYKFFGFSISYTILNLPVCFVPTYFDFKERGREGEKEGKKCQHERETLVGCFAQVPQPGTKPATQGMCPDRKLNWRPYGLRENAQSTEPHQPGLKANSLLRIKVFLSYLSYKVNQFHLGQICPTGNFNKIYMDILLL